MLLVKIAIVFSYVLNIIGSFINNFRPQPYDSFIYVHLGTPLAL
jgi:hypothetical protein